MMPMIADTALLVLMGVMDRWRGDAADIVSRTVEKAIYGYLVAALSGHTWDWLTGPIVLAMAFGMSPGWGEPLGALLRRQPMDQLKLEWWQVGILKHSAISAMIARGAIWGAPALPLAWFDPSLIYVSLAFLIAVPVAPYLFRDWEIQEFARGCIAGAVIVWLNA